MYIDSTRIHITHLHTVTRTKLHKQLHSRKGGGGEKKCLISKISFSDLKTSEKFVQYFIRTFFTRGCEITLLRAAVALDDSMVLELER